MNAANTSRSFKALRQTRSSSALDVEERCIDSSGPVQRSFSKAVDSTPRTTRVPEPVADETVLAAGVTLGAINRLVTDSTNPRSRRRNAFYVYLEYSACPTRQDLESSSATGITRVSETNVFT